MRLSTQFENRIEREIWAQGNYCARIPTGAKIVGKGQVRMQKTPFDFAASINGRAVFFDAKSTGESTFNIGSMVMRTKKVHQFNELTAAYRAGAIAGYLIWFYDLRLITWAPIAVVARKNLVSINPQTDGCRSQLDTHKLDLEKLAMY